MIRAVAPLLLLLVRAPELSAQGARERIFGRARGRDGKPWNDAEVILFSRPIPWFEDLGVADEIRVRTDLRGKFHAGLLPGRSYSAWAVSWKGSPGVSPILEGVVPGKPIRLVEEEGKPIRIRIRCSGTARWKEPLRLRVVAPSKNLYIRELPIDARGECMLPVLPGRHCYVEIWNRQGVLLRHRKVLLLEKDRRAILAHRAASDGSERMKDPGIEPVLLPPPIRVRLRVLAKEDGSAIPGAGVRHEAADYFLSVPLPGQWSGRRRLHPLVGTTDLAGRCSFEIPSAVDVHGLARKKPEYLFQIDAAGRATERAGWSTDGWYERPVLDDEAVAKGETPELVVRLEKGRTIQGRILEREKKPAAGWPLLYRLPGYSRRQGFLTTPGLVRTDEEGNFAIHGLVAGPARSSRQLSISMWLPDSSELAASGDRPILNRLQPYMDPAALDRLARKEGDLTLPAMDLSDFVVVDLEVRHANSDAASFARLATDADEAGAPELFCDRRGRARLLLSARRSILVTASGAGYAVVNLEGDGTARGRSLAVSTTLEPLARVEGRIVDPRGQGIAGARLRICSTMMRNPSAATRLIVARNRAYLGGKTGAEGRFRLEFIPDEHVGYGLEVKVKGRASWRGTNRRGALQVGAHSVDDVVIELPARR